MSFLTMTRPIVSSVKGEPAKILVGRMQIDKLSVLAYAVRRYESHPQRLPRLDEGEAYGLGVSCLSSHP